ncbi:Uncharacterised protein [Bacteroides finegoldii]|jgi:hypothetical protein|uniref:Uncharacterized protein n=1 Tax=Bacteroides finegoldii TaxID=338188 RepID=A0A174G7I6_9BACE|nr:Uncharacterised protein [Bacteroides finegoldii]
MNLETKITIYKFTPQVFTLTPEIRLSRNLGSADSSIKTSWNSYLNLYFITIHDEN